MVRGLAVVCVFLLCVIALIVMQPSLQQRPPLPEPIAVLEATPETAVTREQVSLLTEVTPNPEPDLEQLISQAMSVEAQDTQVAATPALVPASTPQAALIDQDSVQGMTWAVLRGLNSATGRGDTPGAPGSLLNVLVARSLTEAEAHLSEAKRAYISALAREATAAF